MTVENEQVMDIARSWMMRVNEPDFDGWDEFTAWLEADPAHLETYEAALDEDAWAKDLIGQALSATPAAVLPLTPANDEPSGRERGLAAAINRRRVVGGAIAACLVAVLGWATILRGPAIEEIVTAPGEQRSIALADGSRIVVNGNSAIAFDPEHPRRITLARGEALFDVFHDAADPFIVTVGSTRLIDEGTVFNVVHDNGALDVAVAEGMVVYDDGDDNILLEPGDRLVRSEADGAAEVTETEIDTVGSWSTGLLHYRDASLAEVAADLSHVLSKPVRAVRGAERIRFTGTLAINGREQELLASAGPLLGVEITEAENSWEMTPEDASPR